MDEQTNKTPQTPVLSRRVYYVSSLKDESVLLAMDIKIEEDLVRWFDTVKERIMRIDRIVENSPGRFIFERSEKEGGGTYIFTPLTMQIYREKVKSKLMLPKEFENEEDLFFAFERTRDNAW